MTEASQNHIEDVNSSNNATIPEKTQKNVKDEMRKEIQIMLKKIFCMADDIITQQKGYNSSKYANEYSADFAIVQTTQTLKLTCGQTQMMYEYLIATERIPALEYYILEASTHLKHFYNYATGEMIKDVEFEKEKEVKEKGFTKKYRHDCYMGKIKSSIEQVIRDLSFKIATEENTNNNILKGVNIENGIRKISESLLNIEKEEVNEIDRMHLEFTKEYREQIIEERKNGIKNDYLEEWVNLLIENNAQITHSLAYVKNFFKRLISSIILRSKLVETEQIGSFILIGQQGTGKSSLATYFSISEDYFAVFNVSGQIDEKEMVHIVKGKNVVEIPEAEKVLRTASNNSILKRIITQKKFDVRLAYERNAEGYPNIFTIIATTNEGSILNDPTGNRRFTLLELDNAYLDSINRGFFENVDIKKKVLAYCYVMLQENTSEFIKIDEDVKDEIRGVSKEQEVGNERQLAIEETVLQLYALIKDSNNIHYDDEHVTLNIPTPLEKKNETVIYKIEMLTSEYNKAIKGDAFKLKIDEILELLKYFKPDVYKYYSSKLSSSKAIGLDLTGFDREKKKWDKIEKVIKRKGDQNRQRGIDFIKLIKSHFYKDTDTQEVNIDWDAINRELPTK